MKKVLLTGGTGFIGSTLKDYLLKQNVEVITISRKNNRSIENSNEMTYEELFNNYSAIKEIDAVIHLAARVHQFKISEEDEDIFYQDNCVLTDRLAKYCIDNNIKKFIFASTVKVMGDTTDGGVITEADQSNPTDPYGKSKFAAEKSLHQNFIGTKVHCAILRFPMVYGPKNKGNMLPLLKAAKKGVPLPLKGSTAKRSIIFVENICDAIWTILLNGELPDIKTFYLTDSRDVSTEELYSIIFRLIHKRNGVFYLPNKLLYVILKLAGQTGLSIYSRLFDSYCFSSEEFCKYYKWNPPFTIEEGMEKTIKWFLADCIKS